MKTLRIGVLGAGGIAAKLHLPEMATVPDAEVVVLAGRKASRLETLCRKFNVPRWTHAYDEVISDPDIDGVIIALPHPLHVRYGIAALEAGKHVHIQKPLSTSLDEAAAFVRAVENTNRTVLALPFVARPHVLEARARVERGDLGRVASAHARFSHGGPEVYYATIQNILGETPDDALWFFDAAQADVGALFDMGVYSIAHLCAVLGSVVDVACCCTTVAKPTTLEDTAAILMRFANGAIGTAETGWCDGARTYGFSIHGTTGKLVNPPLTGDLELYRPSSLVDEDAPLLKETIATRDWPDENSHQHWVRCIRDGVQPPIANARFARHVTEIMLRSLASAREGRTAAVESRIEAAG
ncbi:MAG: Gfo/Idh/MocA family oxidoreductase [Planctomyces sp.]|nr:Gfo/Idh/MocA family oxidoreductase [Planctomyces sp.]